MPSLFFNFHMYIRCLIIHRHNRLSSWLKHSIFNFFVLHNDVEGVARMEFTSEVFRATLLTSIIIKNFLLAGSEVCYLVCKVC